MKINNKSCIFFIKFSNIILKVIIIIIDNKSIKNSFYNLHPQLYGREIFNQIISKYNEKLVMGKNEYYFVNGLIRLYKLKNY